MDGKKRKAFLEGMKFQWRAMKIIHTMDAQLFPSITLTCLIKAIQPFLLIFFSAQILNELASTRRMQVLWTWVVFAVAVQGTLTLLEAILTHRTQAREELFYHRYKDIFVRKSFTMDFADVDLPETHTLRAQVQQNANWSGWGFPYVPHCYEELVEAVIGILGGITLTVSLFTASVPASAGRLTVLNHPLFIAGLVILMLFISIFSARIESYVEGLQADFAAIATLSNRIFGYFGFYGAGGQAVDVRMYDQQTIAAHYYRLSDTQGFGPGGPFARLYAGKGGVLSGLSVALSTVFTGTIYLFTCLKALGGALGVGSITQYVGAATALASNVRKLFSTLGSIINNGEFLRISFTFLDIPNHMYQGSLTTEKRNDRNYQVEFRDVSFRYPGAETWALRHVSLKLHIGSRMAVVGENGSGKTTFIKLLCRLYDPQEGEILLNGINIKKYRYDEYMHIFSVVFQDFQLLSQPLGANVAGRKSYDTARVEAALRDAGFADRLAAMPDGLDTMLYRDYGDQGVQISGGEAQKIAIARAIYKDTPFLILDEPTAALDPVAEAEIYAQLNQIIEDRTVVYISHRLSSCRFCDEILVFDEGEVIQHGSHEELIHMDDGKYAMLWNAQAQYYTD